MDEDLTCQHPSGDFCANCVSLNDPPFVAKFSPHAAFKHKLLRHLRSIFDLSLFVETGTCRGDTLDALQDYFDELHSIELHRGLHNYAVERFEGKDHIHLIYGNSNVMLAKVLEKISKPCLIFIDAHATGGDCADEGLPLEEELAAIYEHAPTSLVVIDDMWPENLNTLPVPGGWVKRWFNGVIFVHKQSLYDIPERF